MVSVTSRCSTLLWALNSGHLDLAARSLDDDEAGAAAIVAATRRVPPVCDVSHTAIEAAATTAVDGDDDVVLSLADATGATVLEIRLLWGVDSSARTFPETSLALNEIKQLAAAEWRPVDTRGRLPAEQFVGSSSWRLGRLFTTLTSPFDVIDRGPRSDLEAA